MLLWPRSKQSALFSSWIGRQQEPICKKSGAGHTSCVSLTLPLAPAYDVMPQSGIEVIRVVGGTLKAYRNISRVGWAKFRQIFPLGGLKHRFPKITLLVKKSSCLSGGSIIVGCLLGQGSSPIKHQSCLEGRLDDSFPYLFLSGAVLVTIKNLKKPAY